MKTEEQKKALREVITLLHELMESLPWNPSIQYRIQSVIDKLETLP